MGPCRDENPFVLIQIRRRQFGPQCGAGNTEQFTREYLIAMGVAQSLFQDHPVNFLEDCAVNVGCVGLQQPADEFSEFGESTIALPRYGILTEDGCR